MGRNRLSSARLGRYLSERMKAGVEHRVPLSTQAIDVLESARSLDDKNGLIFPSPLRKGQALSDMTLTKVLKVAGLHDRATVHGMRTSFKTWTMEQTGYALGGRRGGPGPPARRRCGAGLCAIRPVRPPTGTHAAVGRLPESQPHLSLLGHSGVFETGVGPLRYHYGSASCKRYKRPVTMIATKCPICAPS